MPEEKQALFTEKVQAGNRSYFFNVKTAKNGSKYLVILESRPKEEGFETSRVMVFPDHLPEFRDAFNKAYEFMGAKPKAKPASASDY